ncbi:B12-binding domain-containing radical SAM protein [Desulfonema magnum]|uniref:Cobalamin-binding radical SAM domain-containing protein n=1 Tax=Desulfonema magnum TaxID=45655 RepID=A0A975GLI8_9BACT|nr:radical SAM protein [Desulfonema magnum]QTA85812.1 Cobalamin-binding radical SAM domain-containing protein [Desulfonema magnum]
MINKKKFYFRIVVPAFPNFNIYTSLATRTTSVGPIYVATNANKLDKWEVEVIDENNCHGRFWPRDEHNLLDHDQLQKERPADVVGFYASISSTVPRIYELAKFYKTSGVKTVAGGKHVEALIEEALDHDIDVVVLREGEITIKELLSAWEKNQDLSEIRGIAFLKDGSMYKTEKRPLIHDFDMLPLPDFNLMRYAKIKMYPITRTRGCNFNCEFCTVKDKARSASPENMMKQIRYLVETRGARKFFEASDHFASNREEAIEFCKLLTEYQRKYNIKLKITVQVRITDARYPALLEAMRQANINNVCIGYESPIDEELIAMRKGYLSKDLVNWTNTFHKYGFFIHGMFIFGYPRKPDASHKVIPLTEKAKYFREFIKKSKIDTLQVLLTIPLPGTELRKRLLQENRIFTTEQLGWEYYDGQYPLFMPDDGAEPEEMQQIVGDLMYRFYHFSNFWKIVKNILINFPMIVFTSAFTIIVGRVRYIISAFNIWHRKYFRNYALRFGGYFIVKNWFKNFRKDPFLKKLNIAKAELKESKHEP